MGPSRTPRPPQSPDPTDLHLWQIRAIQDLLWIGVAIAALWFSYYLRSIFAPVLIGLLLAYIFNPVITFAEHRWHVPRPLTITGVLSLLLLITVSFISWSGPLIVTQGVTFAQNLPSYVRFLTERYNLTSGTIGDQVSALANSVQEDPISILQTIFTGTGQAFGFIGTVLGTTTYIIVSLTLIPIYFFFFAWSFPAFLQRVRNYLPASQREHILDIIRAMDEAVAGFFRGRLVVAFVMAILLAVGWFLTDVPYWFLLGVSAGVLSIIPYAASIVWILVLLIKYLDVTTSQGNGTSEWMAIVVWPSVAYGVVQFIEGWILTPWIQSDSTNLSPVTVLIVVFIGGAVGGLAGLLLAIPIAACFKIVCVKVLLPRLQRWARNS